LHRAINVAQSHARKREQKAFFARVSPSAMAPPPNCFLCFSRAITRLFAREKQRKQLGGGAIADGETRQKTRVETAP
jgi:hypothetical protein